MRYKGWISRLFLAMFVVSFLGLMYLGLQPPQGIYVTLGRICTVGYFLFFGLMYWYTRWDPVKPVPQRLRRFRDCSPGGGSRPAGRAADQIIAANRVAA